MKKINLQWLQKKKARMPFFLAFLLCCVCNVGRAQTMVPYDAQTFLGVYNFQQSINGTTPGGYYLSFSNWPVNNSGGGVTTGLQTNPISGNLVYTTTSGGFTSGNFPTTTAGLSGADGVKKMQGWLGSNHQRVP